MFSGHRVTFISNRNLCIYTIPFQEVGYKDQKLMILTFGPGSLGHADGGFGGTLSRAA